MKTEKHRSRITRFDPIQNSGRKIPIVKGASRSSFWLIKLGIANPSLIEIVFGRFLLTTSRLILQFFVLETEEGCCQNC